MGSQCTVPTRKVSNLGLFQMARCHVKATIPVTGKGRAKGAFSAKRFFIKIKSLGTPDLQSCQYSETSWWSREGGSWVKAPPVSRD